jgi:NAD(P)-dependent dehydrogenase (short-subunit alcohol dehydrogenase family)
VFYQPLFPDVDYDVRVSQISPERTVVSLTDGSTEVTRVTFDYLPGAPPLVLLPSEPSAPLPAARVLSAEQLAEAWATDGWYSPSASSYNAFLEMVGVLRPAWGDAIPVVLMATSYLTGMELPGESAMYFQLHAEFLGGSFELPSEFHQQLTSYDRRWGMVKSRFRFFCGKSVWASGELQAFLRPPRVGISSLAGALSPQLASRFADKVAIVVGASRGFGSSLALTLAGAGATVISLYAHSSEDAERLRDAAAGLSGKIIPSQCDASDPAACREIRQEVLTQHGRVDWLICSAIPSLQALRIEPAAFERIDRFTRQGFALVLAPLTSFLDLLSDSGGSVLLVSSQSVEDPPPIWPHYVALKCAVEGLTRVAAREYPKVSFCIARPTKLLTDLVNTPMGRSKAETPETAAARILSEAAIAARPGKVCYLK